MKTHVAIWLLGCLILVQEPHALELSWSALTASLIWTRSIYSRDEPEKSSKAPASQPVRSGPSRR